MARNETRRRALPAVVTLLAAASGGAAGATLTEALTRGTPLLDVRYRFEQVDESGFDRQAEASTIRLRLGYTTGAFHGFVAHVDVEAIEPLGAEKYDSTANGRGEFPVVADPEQTEVNQAWLGYRARCGAALELGRQRIVLDNHRFVGNVGFRQNEQTFDALAVSGKAGERLELYYAHLINANRPFGEDHPDPRLADLDLDADLLRAALPLRRGTLVAYVHRLKLEDTPDRSQRNLGVRFTGAAPIRGTKLLYALELAEQDDYADGAPFVDAGYRLAEIGFEKRPIGVRLGYERLGGDGDYGFSTPLATLHAHNGWADKFLTTPDAGLEDRYLALAANALGLSWEGVYHDFGADAGGADYGSEIDLRVERAFGELAALEVAYASYAADGFSTDTDKLWLTARLAF